MRIIRDRRISESHWRHAPDGVLAEAQSTKLSGAIIVTLVDWRRRKTELVRRAEPVGVRLGADDDLDEIVDDLDSIALVALEFGSFTEGRAYTYARKLRQRHGYRGEIRAVGDVSRDRLAFMERCGFDAYELRSDDDLQDALNAFAEISDVYQPCADAWPVIASRRALRRLPSMAPWGHGPPGTAASAHPPPDKVREHPSGAPIRDTVGRSSPGRPITLPVPKSPVP